jgi:hypothetical protein
VRAPAARRPSAFGLGKASPPGLAPRLPLTSTSPRARYRAQEVAGSSPAGSISRTARKRRVCLRPQPTPRPRWIYRPSTERARPPWRVCVFHTSATWIARSASATTPMRERENDEEPPRIVRVQAEGDGGRCDDGPFGTEEKTRKVAEHGRRRIHHAPRRLTAVRRYRGVALPGPRNDDAADAGSPHARSGVRPMLRRLPWAIVSCWPQSVRSSRLERRCHGNSRASGALHGSRAAG